MNKLIESRVRQFKRRRDKFFAEVDSANMDGNDVAGRRARVEFDEWFRSVLNQVWEDGREFGGLA